MANNSPNLKVNIGADTSQFSKGIKQVQADTKSLEKLGGDALGSIGSAIGVDTTKLQQMSGAFRALGSQMEKSASVGVASFGKLLSAINPVATAVVGLGVAGIIGSWKALNSEAENFKSLVEGANIELAKTAYIDTYKQVLHDFNGDMAKSFATTQSNWSKFWSTLGTNFKQYFLAGGSTGASLPGGSNTNVFLSQISAATEKGKQAEDIANRIYAIQRQISGQMVQAAELDAEIAKQKEIAYDNTNATAVRAAALAKATELIHEKYSGTNGIAVLNKQLADAMQDMVDLAGSTPQQIDEANAQRVKANQLIRAESDEVRALSRRQNSVNAELAKEVEARNKILALQNQRASLGKLGSLLDIENVQDLSNRNTLATGAAGISLAIAPSISTQQWNEFFSGAEAAILKQYPDGLKIGVAFDTNEGLIDLTNALNSTLANLADSVGQSIGQLMGDLLTGGDAWSNFANIALSSFGNMAVNVGKIAIEAGLAVLGIKAALESLNPYVAIAAGVALVALGSAVKAGLSNVASGGYASSTSVASSTSNYSSNNDYVSSEITVRVEGTLEADGSKLITVINNASNRKNHTT